MLSKRIAALPLAVLLLGCPNDDPGPPGELEIGYRDLDGQFVRITNDMSLPVVLGANGLNMLVPSLRAVDIDPTDPEPNVTVDVSGIIMAADLKFDAVDMQGDGDGYVLWDLNVPFQTDLCCYNCVEGFISASLQDRTGRMFVGDVRVILSRNGTCPDTSVCCGDVNACPDPAITQVCE